MMELITDPSAWVALATLTILELVLGIDNLVFISIVSERLPENQRQSARRLGLSLALIMRLGLLFSIAWIVSLKEPVITIMEHAFSWRDLILLGGGMFLLAKATLEINNTVEGMEEDHQRHSSGDTFAGVIGQIVVLDMIFSMDSILTAVGLTDQLPIMVAAIVISMAIMVWAAEPVADFVERHLSVKLLALAFLLLIAVVLVAEGFQIHIPKGYIYFSVAFASAVQVLAIIAKNNRKKKRAKAAAK